MELTVNVRMEEGETSYYILYFNFIYIIIYIIYRGFYKISAQIKIRNVSLFHMFQSCWHVFPESVYSLLNVCIK